LTADDRAVLNNLQDRNLGNDKLNVAVAQMNRDIRDQQQTQDFINALTHSGQGGGGTIPGGGSLYPSGGLLPCAPDCLPPMQPTIWYPNDPASDPGSPDDVTPSGPGIACTTTTDSGTGPDAPTDLGSAATQATVLQTTRYLRIANATDRRVTVYLRYYTPTEKGDSVWFPANPGVGKPLKFELDPGESVDAMDGDWRINASAVRIWAASGDVKWFTFAKKDLPLVPETTPQGVHGYESSDLQVFNFTVR
jgi:hypothetical protein